MQCGAVKVISASVWCLWSWDFPVCVAYNVFYAPHKLLGPYLQLALFSPSLRTCNSWPFSLVNYLHVKQWIKMMALRKMLLILRKKKKKSTFLPEISFLRLVCPSHPEKETLSFSTQLLHLHREMFSASDFEISPWYFGDGVRGCQFDVFLEVENHERTQRKVCETARAAAEIPDWGR